MKLPLERRLKRRTHVEIALLQDELVDLVYGVDEGAVIHGGTAIWRCYGGNRFSEDVDLYSHKQDALEQIPANAASRGIRTEKFRKTSNVLFAEFSNGEATVKLDANFAARKKGVVMPFEKTDGSSMQVLTLTPEQLMAEKMGAYLSRKLIRDLYDVFHLSGLVKEDARIAREVRLFLEQLPRPVDEENLKAIVYSGAVPSFAQLASALERRWK